MEGCPSTRGIAGLHAQHTQVQLRLGIPRVDLNGALEILPCGDEVVLLDRHQTQPVVRRNVGLDRERALKLRGRFRKLSIRGICGPEPSMVPTSVGSSFTAGS